MALPATGGNWAQVVEPSLNPLAVRYGTITDIFTRDYYNADGTVYNMADPSVGLAPVTLPDGSKANLFTPFAADGVSIREDLLITAPGTNQGFYHIGLLKEDSISVTPDQTVQQTPSAQQIRTARNVLTKLEDKIAFEPLEETPLIRYLKYELPLQNVPALGSPGLIIPRGNTDQLQHRVIVAMIVDTDGQLIARVLPHVMSDKKGKEELGRKNPYTSALTYELLPCPFAKQVEWHCYAGTQWNASADFSFETTPPKATPVTGLKANVQFPTPADITSPVYTAQIGQAGVWSSATVAASPTVAGGFTTIQLTSLTASTAYDGVQVTATGSNLTATSPVSNSFTSTAS